MVKIIKISDIEVNKLLSMEENHFCDFNAIEVSPGRITKTLAAFCNAEGGELFVGIDDNPRFWRGSINIEAANTHLQVFDEFFPLGPDFAYEFFTNGNADGLGIVYSR